MNNTPSKNDIGYLTEAVIEMVDVINEEAKEFRYSFEDSRDFNTTIADWSAQFLDWWDAEAEADHLHDYLESIRDFTLTKVRAETEPEKHTYTIEYTRFGYLTIEAKDPSEAYAIAKGLENNLDHPLRQQIKWDGDRSYIQARYVEKTGTNQIDYM